MLGVEARGMWDRLIQNFSVDYGNLIFEKNYDPGLGIAPACAAGGHEHLGEAICDHFLGKVNHDNKGYRVMIAHIAVPTIMGVGALFLIARIKKQSARPWVEGIVCSNVIRAAVKLYDRHFLPNPQEVRETKEAWEGYREIRQKFDKDPKIPKASRELARKTETQYRSKLFKQRGSTFIIIAGSVLLLWSMKRRTSQVPFKLTASWRVITFLVSVLIVNTTKKYTPESLEGYRFIIITPFVSYLVGKGLGYRWKHFNPLSFKTLAAVHGIQLAGRALLYSNYSPFVKKETSG